jgi:hypothetical protein
VRFLLGRGSWGAIVPHAPLLVPEINPAFRDRAVLASLEEVRTRRADVVFLISPHGERSGVYTRGAGDLKRMSIPNSRVTVDVDPELSGEFTFEWGEPRLDAPVDHGIVVPLLLNALPSGVPLIACALEEATGPGKSFSGGRGRAAAALAAAIATFAQRRNVAVIASAHAAAGLGANAPLTERPGADALEDRVLNAVERDVGDLLQIDESSWVRGDPCGRAPLLTLAHLFQNHAGTVHGYDSSQGVGYIVATVDAR